MYSHFSELSIEIAHARNRHVNNDFNNIAMYSKSSFFSFFFPKSQGGGGPPPPPPPPPPPQATVLDLSRDALILNSMNNPNKAGIQS